MAARYFCDHAGRNKPGTVRTQNKLMKSILSLSAMTVLAALALVGCNQNSPSNSTVTPSPNSSTNGTSGMMDRSTNMPATNTSPHRDANKTAAADDATR
jgi:hypothetical protein